MNTTALACTAALGFLLFGLAAAVSMMRLRTGRLANRVDEPGDLLHKLVRAHANTAEYVPFIGLLMLYFGSRAPAPAVVWTMVAITGFRFLLVAGLLFGRTMDRVHPVRFVGALGTYVCGFMLCAALLRSI